MHTLNKPRYFFAAVLGFGLCAGAPALAQNQTTKPLWEVGIGAGIASLPDYRGSDRQRSYLVPVPYLVYRGEFLRADRDGLRGVMVQNELFELNISLGASLPVSSKGNDARRGLPSLKPTLELGPSLDINLIKRPGLKLELSLPLRGAATVEASPRYVGWTFEPNVHLEWANAAGLPGWNLSVAAGPLFADRKNQAFFYSVSAAQATATRSAYDAPGGYAGAKLSASISKRYDQFWVGGFARYDALGGARFEDSPLVRRKNNLSVGVAFSWIVGESSQRVPVER